MKKFLVLTASLFFCLTQCIIFLSVSTFAFEKDFFEPTLAVIIPVFNNEKYISECIESLKIKLKRI